MIIYFDDILDLKAIEIGLMYYFHEISNEPQSFVLAPRLNKLIDKIDKEIEYYDNSSQEN